MQQFIDDLVDTMREYSGVGLAAPQVHESLRIFVADLASDGGDEGRALAVINPEIEIIGAEIAEGWEGCLSIPDIRGKVPRSAQIKMTGLDRQGKRLEITAKDFPARVIQHETDHLDGILFFDRMKSFETLSYMEEFSRYHARKDEDDEDDG